MGTTTNHNLRYPEDANAVAVPADVKKLADDVDAKLVSSAGGTVSGNISFTGTTIVQTPTANNHAANKSYVDTSDAAINAELGTNPSGTFSTVADRLNTQDHPASTTDNTVSRYDGTQGKLQTSTVVIDDNGRLTTVTGATGGYGFVGGAVHLTGTGTPESAISAAPGSTYLQTDAANDVKGWIRWIKTTGTSNTGWIAGPEADTGTRNLNGVSWQNGWAPWGANSQRMRRIGNIVDLEMDLNSNPATNDVCYTLPIGFRPFSPSVASYFTARVANTAVPAGLTIANGIIGVNRASLAGNVMYSRINFITSDPWPTSLPGVAG